MRVSIFGLGYVGAVTWGCLSRDGHEVVGVDIDPGKLATLQRGESPIIEEGMAELIGAAATSGRATVTDSADVAVANSDISLVCVGTPSQRSGAHDLTALGVVAAQIGAAIAAKSGNHAVLLRSTVPPGTVDTMLRPKLEEHAGVAVPTAFMPEFLREGSSIRDYDGPPYTVVGGDADAVAMARSLFGHIGAPFVVTETGVAEMVKFCCNAFHAYKITFANEIGRLSRAIGLDGRAVMDIVCQDQSLNISTAYLRPGYAFGGSCLPKDLRGLTRMALDNDVHIPALSNLLASNERHIDHALNLIMQTTSRRVGLVGVSFKPGTDDLRESPLVELAERLIGKGYQLAVYDPVVELSRLVGSNKAFISQALPHISAVLDNDPVAFLSAAETLVFGRRDGQIESGVLKAPGKWSIVDLAGLPQNVVKAAGRYQGICWPE